MRSTARSSPKRGAVKGAICYAPIAAIAIADAFDVKACAFEHVEAKATGRPSCAPGALLKLSRRISRT
jgi:hypothetical protein